MSEDNKGDYMLEGHADVTISQQVELNIGRLQSLSTLPSVAVQFLDKLLEPQFSPAVVADIVESEPALAVKIFSLIAKLGVSLPDEKFSLRYAMDKLPANDVRDALLSVKVLRPSDFDDSIGGDEALSKRDILLHSLAVACCAKAVAELESVQMDSQLAYLAGLLHDIGKFALEETMPKSFARIVEEARSAQSCLRDVERKHFGSDHTIFGKRFAQKWHLPEKIALAIWLHHSDTIAICESMPDARIAAVVQLADCIAKQAGIGGSGSFDAPEPSGVIIETLGISNEQLQQIRLSLDDQVREKSRILGLDLPNAVADYCGIIGSVVGRLAQDNTKLSCENLHLQAASSHLDFITDFLLSVNADSTAMDIAQNFAIRWQRSYQTGTICLYLAPPTNSQTIQAVVIERLAQSRIVSVDIPDGTEAVPKALREKFAVLDARGYVGWLIEALDVEFDVGRTKLVPLLSSGKVVGVIVFELHWPADVELFEERLKESVSVGGSVLDIAIACQKQEKFAEQFVELIRRPQDMRERIAVTDSSLSALAEIAAGAAHELNNPLAVIAGRAQLLAVRETDQQKKEILEQIQRNANQASAIIEDLMGFAEPKQSRRVQTDVRQILDEAIELTRQKTGVEHINVQVKIGQNVKEVFVDSGQMVSAIANVITNAVESYTDQLGPIEITAQVSGNFVKLQVKDLGCGMDAVTLRKATQPFFSSQPAGRKRGMGLAYTARFVQLNDGLLNIESQPGKGTTVTIYLPRK
jgi:putative nucleotidyltransferase with HDIG domain